MPTAGPHHTQADRSGFRQARLPGDVGAVQELEVAHPTFDLPRAKPDDFALTAQAVVHAQPSMFD
jgi:hypothetical protein